MNCFGDSVVSFSEKVLGVCKKIPKGKVTTYSEIAKAINSPKSMRAVGNALNKNENIILVPCHRVVRSNGFAGGYAEGTKRKINLLRKEGVVVSNEGKIDLKKFFV